MAPPAWRLDPVYRTAERLSDCPLSLNGIAKGYIVERACDAAMAEVPGIAGVMLNVGGDLRCRGAIEGTIGIAAPWADSESSEPLGYIEVKDRSVATSGSSQRGFRIGGRWYSHIFDPRTGLPVDRVGAATVVAERSVDADAFAKACNVLEPEQCVQLARSLGGLEFLIVGKDGRTTRSDGWHRYERPRPGWLASADEPARPGRRSGRAETGRSGEDGRPRSRPGRTSRSSSASRSTVPSPRPAAIGGLTSSSGSRTRMGTRSGRSPCGSRWAAPVRSNGCPT